MITAKCQLQVKYIRHTKETHYYRKYVVKPHLVPTQKGHILISTETLLASENGLEDESWNRLTSVTTVLNFKKMDLNFGIFN